MGKVNVSVYDQRRIDDLFFAYDDLRRSGWQEAMYAPYDTPLEFIVPGSTGVFRGERGSKGQPLEDFWLEDDGDVEFCMPILFRKLLV